MTKVRFVDQTIRDGHQSLWGMRMSAAMTSAAAPYIDRAGYHVVDFTGGAQFAVQLRQVHDDPWQALDIVRANFPTTPLRAGRRVSAVGTFGRSPDAIIDLFNTALIRHGVDSFWIYDCLYNMGPWERACRVVHDAGARVLPAIMFGESPVLTDGFFADRVRQMVAWGFVDGIYVEDAASILTPQRTATLIPALVDAAQGTPIELHCHTTSGLAQLNYLEAVEHGVDILHTCSRPLANGPSLPSVEAMVHSLVARGHEPDLDVSVLEPVAEHFERVAAQEGFPLGVPFEHDARIYQHQLPGGMTGTLKSQLAEHGLEDRFPDVLEEIPRVRAELGHPVPATPFAQLVGIQAVLNIISSERYAVIPDEVIRYAAGHLGEPLAPIDPDVLDRIQSAPRWAEWVDWEPPNESLADLRQIYGGRSGSDEELLSRYLAPADDVDRALDHGRPDREYVFRGGSPADLVRDVMKWQGADFVRLEREGISLTLRRRPQGMRVGG